jgi:hypothetical protein
VLWVGVVLYFAAWALAWPMLLAAYAKALLAVAKLPVIFKLPLGLLTYLLFAAVTLLPVAAISEINAWRTAVDEGSFFVVWFAIWHLLSFVPGAVLFRRRYIEPLKSAGYFKSR